MRKRIGEQVDGVGRGSATLHRTAHRVVRQLLNYTPLLDLGAVAIDWAHCILSFSPSRIPTAEEFGSWSQSARKAKGGSMRIAGQALDIIPEIDTLLSA